MIQTLGISVVKLFFFIADDSDKKAISLSLEYLFRLAYFIPGGQGLLEIIEY
jgi:hypothetical protein